MWRRSTIETFTSLSVPRVSTFSVEVTTQRSQMAVGVVLEAVTTAAWAAKAVVREAAQTASRRLKFMESGSQKGGL